MSQSSLPADTALVRQVARPQELSSVPRLKGSLAYEVLNGAAVGFRERDMSRPRGACRMPLIAIDNASRASRAAVS